MKYITLLLVMLGTAQATIVRMDITIGTQPAQSLYLELYDTDAPITVANFLNYIENANGDRRFDNTFIHRSYSQTIDIIQGGGYSYDPNLGPLNLTSAPHIPEDARIFNEYYPPNRSSRGTIAMARLGSGGLDDPNGFNTATSEWFINVVDNFTGELGSPDNLEYLANYTVFGRVLGNGINLVDAINNLADVNAGNPFNNLPVENAVGAITTSNMVIVNRVVRDPPMGIIGAESLVDCKLVALGAGPGSCVITIENKGAFPLTIINIGNTDGLAAPFTLTNQGTCFAGFDLPSLNTCTVVVEVEPTALGEFTESINVASSDVTQPDITINLRATGAPSVAQLEVDPALTLAFDTILTGETDEQVITISNVGGGSLLLGIPVISGTNSEDFSILPNSNCEAASLAINDSCTFTVQLSGNTEGDKTAAFELTAEPGTQSIQLSLTGSVNLSQQIVTGEEVKLGDTRIDLPTTRFFQFGNVGGTDLIVSDIEIIGPDAPLFTLGGACTTTLRPNVQCTESIDFTLDRLGLIEATLRITSDDPDNPVVELPMQVTSSTDNDQVPDEVELAGPNNGDGNQDGILDVEQEHVTSLPGMDGNYVTLEAAPGQEFTFVEAIENPSNGNAPRAGDSSLEFRQGFFWFGLQNVPVGGAATVTIYFPAGYQGDTYFKYSNNSQSWYQFDFDGTTGAEFFDDRIVLHFVDGNPRGDNDLVANGIIRDPGGPASLGAGSVSSSGGGGGGCTLNPSPDRKYWSFDFVLFMLGLMLLHGMRKRV